MSQISTLPMTQTRRHFNQLRPKHIIMFTGFVIIVAAIGLVFINLFSDNRSSTATNQIRSVLSGEELTPFAGTDDSFSILMPSNPNAVQTTNTSGGHVIPVTTYERSIENNAKNYTLAIYDYTGLPFGDESQALQAALKTAMENTPGAQVTSIIPSKYGEYNSIEATYSTAVKERIYESHIRYVIKDAKLYSMILIGGDQTKFDEFANSLKLDKKG